MKVLTLWFWIAKAFAVFFGLTPRPSLFVGFLHMHVQINISSDHSSDTGGKFSPTNWCDLPIFCLPILIPDSTSSNPFAIMYSYKRSPYFLLISKPVHPNFFNLFSYSITLSFKTIPESFLCVLSIVYSIPTKLQVGYYKDSVQFLS